MSNRVTNFTDLIQRITASCLLTPLTLTHHPETSKDNNNQTEESEVDSSLETITTEECEQEEEHLNKNDDSNKLLETEALMFEMFDAVSDLKKAYVSLQEAHCPWDPVKMSVADMEVVKELKRIGRLKERFNRMRRSGGKMGFAPLREAVVPYEETVEELRREVKGKDAEVENLKEKLRSMSGKKGKFVQSKRKVSCSQGVVAVAPVPELFEATMSQVKETSKSFTSVLLSLMHTARWDIGAAVRSIESETNTTSDNETITEPVGSHHAKYALESYICCKIFQGFDHETFYIDGSLSSLLNPDQFHRDCFTQYRDMSSMDPTELLGILPTCHFGQFCSRKYLSIIHPKMEESLFGNLEQHSLVSAGNHPRSKFYGLFLRLAKAVWLLHLLAFALDPSPFLFSSMKGAEFQPEYMESVVRFSGRGMPLGLIVGIPVTPGFKLGTGSIIKARVYLVSRK
ncbi:hypothetical protein IFM89_028064 [Coptis chinensis]|uniref:DUF641 domain-containing protein n=1 Tax=Coptis chinensis TaxID=261450 RepID=A0A835HHR8_9MAGN|nr:hypothetical protein IFM89_028064 [Coptis chinensis]